MSSPSIMPPSSLSKFNSVIDSCRNILRKEGITGMDSMKHLTLYILSRALDFDECKRLSVSEEFAWERFMVLSKIDSKRQECFELLYNPAGGDLISNLDSIFGTRNFNFKLRNVDNHVAILKLLDSVNLKELEGSVDILGTVYENHLGSGSNKSAMRDLGQYFTDRKVCTYMTRLCDPKVFQDGTAESVLDPTMGTGGFLTTYAKHVKDLGSEIQWEKMQNDVAGYDIDDFVMSVGKINMYLSTGVLFKRIAHRDTLQSDVGELHQRMKFKIILANMPFGVKGLKFVDSCKRVKEMKCDGTKSEPLFLNLMMAALDDGGRCAVVVPDGILDNTSNQHKSTRKYLLDHFALHRVIKMKGKFFSNTGIQPSILYFENTGTPTQSVEFWEVEQSSNGMILESMVLAVPREKFDDACSLDMRRYQEVAGVANTGGYPMVKLGDIVEFKNGKNIPERDRHETGTYPYYASNGINGFVDKSIFEGPSVLLGDQGSAWHKSTHFVETGSKFYAGNHTIVMKSKDTNLNIKYLYYHLLLNDLQSFNKCAALIPELDKERFYSSKLSLPPLPIQQEIVTALDLIYNNAATAKAAATSVKSQMVAVMRSVGARGFERKKLGDIIEIQGGDYITKTTETSGEYPVYGGGAASYYINRFNREPTCVINKDGMSASCVQIVNTRFFLNHHGWTLKVKSADLVEKFLHWQLYFRSDEIFTLATGSCQKGLNQKEFLQFQIFTPPLPIQHEVLAILNEMEAELLTLEQMAAKAEQRAKFILDGYLTPEKEANPNPIEMPKQKRSIKIADEEELVF